VLGRDENDILWIVTALRDLNVFCNGTELHLLCTLLDGHNTGHIDYNFIVTGLSHIRSFMLYLNVTDKGTLEDDRTVLYKTKSLDGTKPNSRKHYMYRL